MRCARGRGAPRRADGAVPEAQGGQRCRKRLAARRRAKRTVAAGARQLSGPQTKTPPAATGGVGRTQNANRIYVMPGIRASLARDRGACTPSDRALQSTRRCKFSDRVWRPEKLGAQAPILSLQALFLCPQCRVMAVVRGRPKGLPGPKFPVRQPAHGCHPFRLATVRGSSNQTWSRTHEALARPQSVQHL